MTHKSTAFKLALLASIACPIALPNLAFAQSADESAKTSAELDEIVVVARKREESLQEVPISVSVFSAKDIEAFQATDLTGIQGAAPNLNLVQGRGSSSSANIFIRGIGQPDALQTFDPGVGVYVDGVYFSRIQGQLFSLSDVERIEVLRGPQGTLYGKNTIGGAINVISRKPSDTFTGKFSFGYGRFDAVQANGFISGPLVEGKLSASLAVGYDRRDGIVTDPVTGNKFNDKDSISTRAILRFTPVEPIELIASFDYTRIDTALTLGQATAPLIQTVLGGAPFTLVNASPDTRFRFQSRTSFTNGEGQELDHFGGSFTANIQLTDTLALTSITAYRDLKPEFFIDIDATERQIGDVKVFIDQEQFSQEVQAKYESDRLKGVIGFFYLRETIASDQIAFADDLFALGPTRVPVTFDRFINDQQTTRSVAVFGQATFNLTDQLSLTAGLRYTQDKKEYFRRTFTQSSFVGLNLPAFTIPRDIPAPFNMQEGGDGTVSFDAVTPSFTIDFKATDDILLYATAGRGFKSGGFNGRANALGDIVITDPDTRERRLAVTFEPETVWTYEAGIKSTLLDGRARLNISGFYSDYKNFQARVGGVLNVGKLRIFGFEAEGLIKPVPELTLSGSIGYLNAEYREFFDTRLPPQPNCNPTRNNIVCEPAFTPEITARFAADYRFDLGTLGSLNLGGDLRYVSSQFLSVDNRRPGLFEDGYTLVNLQARYEDANARFFVLAGVKNLFDTLYKTDAQEFSNVGNIQTVYFGDPVTYSLTVGVNF
jgi:iron complex outermembrane recepter protein